MCDVVAVVDDAVVGTNKKPITKTTMYIQNNKTNTACELLLMCLLELWLSRVCVVVLLLIVVCWLCWCCCCCCCG